LLLGQQIRLVDQQQALPDTPLLLVPHTDPDFGNVLLQILASESDRITTIDDLNDQVGSLNDSPQLTPDLQVSLEGGQQQTVLFCDSTCGEHDITLVS
jgi:hypothetical protein